MTIQIARSLRFRASASAYASLTPAAGTRDKWAIRINHKKTLVGTQQCIISADSASDDQIYFDSSDRLCWDFAGTNRLVSTAVFRDPSKHDIWEFIYDAANATAALRARVFYNGVEITVWTTDTRSSISTGTGKINTNVIHNIGRRAIGTTNFLDGYVSAFALIDNYATPGFSGSLDPISGAWSTSAPPSPLIYLTFSNNSSTANLGLDSGSRGVTWTMTNFSVTAGATNDSLTDTPSNSGTDTGLGGEVTANFAVGSTINLTSGVVLKGGGLDTTGNGSGPSALLTLALPKDRKIYIELVCTNWVHNTGMGLGIVDSNAGRDGFNQIGPNYWCAYDNGVGLRCRINNSDTFTTTETATNDVFQLAWDGTTGKWWGGRNNVWLGGGSPAAGTSPTATISSLLDLFVGFTGISTCTASLNTGQRPFAFAAPSGFGLLCSQGYADPAIKKPKQYFDVNTRVGTGAGFAVSGFQLQPDLVMSKGRSGATGFAIFDSVRGVQKDIDCSSTAIEVTDTQGLSAFNADGFSGGTLAKLNTNAATYVDWMLRKGALPGFDIQGYVGTTLAQTIAHALGVAPEMMIIKRRDVAVESWPVFHKFANAGASGKGGSLFLDTTAAYAADTTIFNNTDPTSSVFSVGTSATSNILSSNFIAYLYASVAGFSKVGQFLGNASTDGIVIDCGFKPRWLLIKRADSTSDWYIFDTARDGFNVAMATLLTDSAAAETSAVSLDFLATGFKCRSASVVNASGGRYLYLAIADVPFKYSASPVPVPVFPYSRTSRLTYLRR